MTDFLVSILHRTFKAQGRDDLTACEAVAREIRRAFPHLDEDQAERDEEIYRMRTEQHLTNAQIAKRKGICERRVEQIIAERLALRRSVA